LVACDFSLHLSSLFPLIWKQDVSVFFALCTLFRGTPVVETSWLICTNTKAQAFGYSRVGGSLADWLMCTVRCNFELLIFGSYATPLREVSHQEHLLLVLEAGNFALVGTNIPTTILATPCLLDGPAAVSLSLAFSPPWGGLALLLFALICFILERLSCGIFQLTLIFGWLLSSSRSSELGLQT
jgi:hypothetical protein